MAPQTLLLNCWKVSSCQIFVLVEGRRDQVGRGGERGGDSGRVACTQPRLRGRDLLVGGGSFAVGGESNLDG